MNADCFLVVSGGLVNRGKNRAGGWVGRNASAHCRCRKLLSRKTHKSLQSKIAQKQQDRLFT